MADKKKDPDLADEGQPKAAVGGDLVTEAPAHETPKQAMARRVRGARFLGGVWLAEDGTPLTDKEAQQAHRAMDKAAAEAREQALRGEA